MSQQHHHPRAQRGQIMHVMGQHEQPVGRVGEQKIAQCRVTRFGVVSQAIEILFEQVQVALCQSAQRVERGNVFSDAV